MNGPSAAATAPDCAKRGAKPMAEQVRPAIGWVFRNADKFGGDRDRLYLISHSSGSHLAGCAAGAMSRGFSLANRSQVYFFRMSAFGP